VIIDAPPANVLTDSAVLTAYTDAVILTVRQDCAPLRLIETAVQSLSENSAEVIGAVFNVVGGERFGGGNYRYGYYGRPNKYDRHGADQPVTPANRPAKPHRGVPV